MKSLIFAIVVVLMFGLSVQAQFAPCSYEREVGVQILPRNFVSSVETERLTALILDWHFRNPESKYCVVAAAGPAERKIEVKATMRTLDRERGQEGWKSQAGRTGGAILIEEISRRLPSRTRSTIRRTARPYLREPRIRVAETLVSVEAWMYGPDGRVVWKGIYSHYFVVEEKTEYYKKSYRLLSGESFGELAPYKDAGKVDLPQTAVFTSDKRLEQLMKLWVLRRALLKENVIFGGDQFLAQKTP